MAAAIEREITTVLPNFRCVFPREIQNLDKSVIKGHLFRCSKPDLLDEAHADMIYKSGIKTIVDLRPYDEYLKIRGDKFLDRYYGIYYPPEPKPRVRTHYNVGEPVKLKQVFSLKHNVEVEEESHLRRVCLDYFKLNYILRIIVSTPFYLVFMSLFYLLIDLLNFRSKYYKNFVKFFARNFLNRNGLAHQYTNMADWSQASICAALKILNEPGSLPAIIQCAHGKDRTGVLTAIILTMMNVPRDEILDDYHISEKELECIKDRVYYDICVRYDMKEEFTEAKRETMLYFLEYIDEKHGSMDQYLDHIGFGADEREQLRQKLRKPIV